MASEDNYNLLVQTSHDNYGDKTVSLVTMANHTTVGFSTLYNSIMSAMRSLETLDLPSTRYGDFHVPILLELNCPEKLLTNVLKEYPCANPTVGHFIEVKRLEQVVHINNKQPSKLKLSLVPRLPSLKVSTNQFSYIK